MADMLVKLYSLPDLTLSKMSNPGIVIRRPLSSEKRKVTEWIARHFSTGWADECEVTFSHQPVTTFIAFKGKEITGFASYETTCKNFFGPMGISEEFRGQGIGEALLLHALKAMRELGYGYGIIGGVGPADFYSKTVGATLIEGSEPGIYTQ